MTMYEDQSPGLERLEESWQRPEGGYEMPEHQTVKDLNGIPVPYGRDVQTDARGMNDVPDGEMMDDRDLDDVGYLSDMNVTTLGNEKRRGGWDPLATPFGAPTRDVNTSGTRGAADIRDVPDDGSTP